MSYPRIDPDSFYDDGNRCPPRNGLSHRSVLTPCKPYRPTIYSTTSNYYYHLAHNSASTSTLHNTALLFTHLLFAVVSSGGVAVVAQCFCTSSTLLSVSNNPNSRRSTISTYATYTNTPLLLLLLLYQYCYSYHYYYWYQYYRNAITLPHHSS